MNFRWYNQIGDRIFSGESLTTAEGLCGWKCSVDVVSMHGCIMVMCFAHMYFITVCMVVVVHVFLCMCG